MKLVLESGEIVEKPVYSPLVGFRFVSVEFDYNDMQQFRKTTPYEKVRYFELLHMKMIPKE